jgi:hypothetical protein
MKKPNVAQFHADYDIHTDHRIHLFSAVSELVPPATVLYPGSYVDIAPSVFFEDVHYIDTDKRAARFFNEHDAVTQLVNAKRARLNRPSGSLAMRFDQTDYQSPLNIEDGSVGLLLSLYAGFISEHCTRYLSPEGYLLANNSHGDASMASLSPEYRLVAVINSRNGAYRPTTKDLDAYLIPKSYPVTIDGLHASGRGVAYTKSPFAYLFQKSSDTQ